MRAAHARGAVAPFVSARAWKFNYIGDAPERRRRMHHEQLPLPQTWRVVNDLMLSYPTLPRCGATVSGPLMIGYTAAFAEPAHGARPALEPLLANRRLQLPGQTPAGGANGGDRQAPNDGYTLYYFDTARHGSAASRQVGYDNIRSFTQLARLGAEACSCASVDRRSERRDVIEISRREPTNGLRHLGRRGPLISRRILQEREPARTCCTCPTRRARR